ncbi:hypothetical protein TNCV_3482711 [Trichonephila clavipes]|nr:hypothetical protein TNCV_3482711 [Trichonephila clavipes]
MVIYFMTEERFNTEHYAMPVCWKASIKIDYNTTPSYSIYILGLKTDVLKADVNTRTTKCRENVEDTISLAWKKQ